MWLPVLGLFLGVVLGIVVGIFLPLSIPLVLARYTAVATLAIIDTIFGSLKASLGRNFKQTIFITGIISNTILAVLVTYAGDILGIDLYLAVVVVFGMRIFQNLDVIRHSLLTKIYDSSK